MDVHGKVYHVGVVQQRNLRLLDVCLIVQLSVVQELQQRKDQVPVQMFGQLLSEVAGQGHGRAVNHLDASTGQ